MKKQDFKNKNGFTLIELLAVIVILAILILFALPNVLQMMENSRKNTFKSEVTKILKTAETVYTDVSTGNKPTDTTRPIRTVNYKDTNYRYLCITLNDLKEGGYMDKNFSDLGYKGYVEVWIPNTGAPTYGINITNGTYRFLHMSLDNLSKDESVAWLNSSLGKKVLEGEEDTGCKDYDENTPAAEVYRYNPDEYKVAEQKDDD